MEKTQQLVNHSNGGGQFSERTAILNQTVCKMRMLTGKLESNFERIDTVYRRVSLDGMARQCSALVSQASLELGPMQGLCWSAINSECDDGLQLSLEEWEKVASEPPSWLRPLFEDAIILSSMPDDESMATIEQGGRVLVIRAPELRADGLLPQFAAIMPEGISSVATQIWWPWVMGGQTPVVLEPTARANVLREVSANVFLQTVESVAATAAG